MRSAINNTLRLFPDVPPHAVFFVHTCGSAFCIEICSKANTVHNDVIVYAAHLCTRFTWYACSFSVSSIAYSLVTNFILL